MHRGSTVLHTAAPDKAAASLSAPIVTRETEFDNIFVGQGSKPQTTPNRYKTRVYIFLSSTSSPLVAQPCWF
jgi:hypothetical protein